MRMLPVRHTGAQNLPMADSWFLYVSLYDQASLESSVCVFREGEARSDDTVVLRQAGDWDQLVRLMFREAVHLLADGVPPLSVFRRVDGVFLCCGGFEALVSSREKVFSASFEVAYVKASYDRNGSPSVWAKSPHTTAISVR